MACFKMSCLGMILQVRGRDGMSTTQNSEAAYPVSRIMYLPGRFPIAFPAVFIFLDVLFLWQVLPNCKGFPLFTAFSQQPASDADSTCPACKTLPRYSYLLAVPW